MWYAKGLIECVGGEDAGTVVLPGGILETCGREYGLVLVEGADPVVEDVARLSQDDAIPEILCE